jgi:hypothetical protein
MPPLITGIIGLLFLIPFSFFAAVNMKHAAHFRYLGKRTVYLTMTFVALSATLFTLGLLIFGMILFN